MSAPLAAAAAPPVTAAAATASKKKLFVELPSPVVTAKSIKNDAELVRPSLPGPPLIVRPAGGIRMSDAELVCPAIVPFLPPHACDLPLERPAHASCPVPVVANAYWHALGSPEGCGGSV